MGKYFNAKIAKLVTYLATFLVAILISKNAYADTPTLSFSASSASNGGVVEMETLAPTSTSGAYTSGSDTLSITTTCSAGYSVYVSATSDISYGTNLVNSDDSNSVIPTGSFTLGSSGLGNIWGIRYGSGNDYIALPAYSSDISGDITPIYTGTNTTIPIYYGINVTPTLAPGEYSGKVLYTVMMNKACTAYTVNFDPNGGAGSMPSQTIPSGVATALSANSFERSGYNFIGWSEDKNAAEADYKNGEEVTDLAVADSSVTLYAVWRAVPTGSMQSFNCSSLNPGQTTTLVDARDNNTYAVLRLAASDSATSISGKCMMIENLKFGSTVAETGNTGDTITVSDATSNYETYASTGSTGENFNNSGTLSLTYVAPSDASQWSSYSGDSYAKRIFTYTDTGTDYTYNTYGYYSWGAAIVACPKGWHLPSYAEWGNSTGLAKLIGGVDAESSATLRSSIYRFPAYGGSFALGGNFYLRSTTGRGDYWLSTQTSGAYAYTALYTSSSIQFYGSSSKMYARSVRCVSGQPSNSMQDFDCSSLSAGQTATLTDVRDDNTYTVLKLATSSTATSISGKCLMTENLKLGSTVAASGKTGDTLTVNSITSHYDTNSSNASYDSFVLSGDITLKYVAISSASSWNTTNNYTNRQFTYTDTGTTYTYNTNGYYSWGAALVACPAGWRLPTYTEFGSDTGLIKLVGGENSTGSSTLRNSTYKFPGYGGSFPLSGTFYLRGTSSSSRGDYWLATQYNNNYAYSMLYTSSKPYIESSANKRYARAVRCIAD